jgi:ribose 5-phosphate isomerase B
MTNKIGIACDHAAYELKEFLVGYLASKGFEVKDFGTHSEESCDYPDFAHALGEAIDNGELERGVALCGSGEGISMTLNKHQSVRAALCWIPEIAKLSRQHNNSNVLSMPARFITNDEALEMLNVWLETEFEGGRHQRRLDKMPLQK